MQTTSGTRLDLFVPSLHGSQQELACAKTGKVAAVAGFPSKQPFLCAVRPRQLRGPSWSRDELRPPSLPLPQVV
eukprot:COSAG06_NODE_1283_length_10013_cov_81.204156_10_plen_74_part_00